MSADRVGAKGPEDSGSLGLHMLKHGDKIRVWQDDVLCRSGTVDLSDPRLGLLWIFQEGLGERKVVHCPVFKLQGLAETCWDLTVLGSEE